MQTVLIIEDDPFAAELLEQFTLKLGDCTPVGFNDPFAALTWAETNQADLVITDYMMPGMDGHQLIAKLRGQTNYADTPILMVTASHDQQVKYAAFDAGANDYLAKPLNFREFAARSRNMLALSSSLNSLNGLIKNLTILVDNMVDEKMKEARQRELELIVRISRAAEFRDPETGAHLQRMSHYAKLIAAGLGMDAKEQQLLLEAAPMHDVGKIGIPDSILLKPGRLSDDELEIMRGHPQIGYALLEGSQSDLIRLASEIALTHHERFDGAGYPNRLKGSDIPIYGRVIAVADVFDALTSSRPYKEAWPLETAAQFLRDNSGSQFDPECVEAFLKQWDQVLEIRRQYEDEQPPSN